MGPVVLSPITRAVFDAALELGAPRAELERASGFLPEAFAGATAVTPLAIHQQVLRAAAQLTRRSDVPLRAATRITADALGVLGFCFIASLDARDVIASYRRYYQVLSTASQLEVAALPDGAVRLYFVPSGPLPLPLAARLGTELGLAATVHMMRAATSPRWAPREATFRHAAPDDAAAHRAFFGCPVVWGADVSGLVMSREALDERTARGDAALRAFLGGQADELLASASQRAQAWRDRVRDVVRRLLLAGTPSGEGVARRLATTERTLRRRLSEEGTSLRACVAEVQRELAIRYLEEGYSVEEIAFMTGFHDASAFRRAFRRWTGTTPGQYPRAAAGAR